MTETIVGAIEPELASAARARARQKPPDNLDAWDHHQRRALAPVEVHYGRLERSGGPVPTSDRAGPRVRARTRGTSDAPHYRMLFDITDAPDQALQEALQVGRRAVAADNRDPFAHFALGRVQTALGDSNDAIAGLEKAIELNPNFALAYYGLATALMYASRVAEAVPHARRAIRQSPHDPAMWALESAAGTAHFVLREYDEAVAWLRRATRHPAHGTGIVVRLHGRAPSRNSMLAERLQLVPSDRGRLIAAHFLSIQQLPAQQYRGLGTDVRLLPVPTVVRPELEDLNPEDRRASPHHSNDLGVRRGNCESITFGGHRS